jgi:hypothetical protein
MWLIVRVVCKQLMQLVEINFIDIIDCNLFVTAKISVTTHLQLPQ